MFADISHDLSGQHGYGPTADRVVALAQKLTSCDSAAIWSLTPQRRAVLHSTSDPAIRNLQPLINTARAGLVWACLHRKGTIRIDDLRANEGGKFCLPWLESHEHPVVSAVGYSLDADDQVVGALILWSRNPGHFTQHRVELGSLLAEHATVFLQLAMSEERTANLALALDSHRRIGIAIGILMNQYRVTEEVGFDMLRVVSQHTHRKLHSIAEDVVLTGELADFPIRKPA
jgi:GAF domain-containing protein